MESTNTTKCKTILVADDEPQIREMLYEYLTSQGYKVIQAIDGQDAVEKFSVNPHDVCLLITDVLMPRMDGFSSFEAMSKTKPSLKVLYMSGYLDHSHCDINFIRKPFTPIQFLQEINGLLED